MVDVADPAPVAPIDRPTRRRRSRLPWIIGAVVVLLVGAGVLVSVSVSFHYLHAAALTTDGGGWTPPDNRHMHVVQTGQYTDSIVAPRPGHAQTFELEVINESAVSQTVLGLTDGKTLADPGLTGEPVHLAMSTTRVWPFRGPVRFTSEPVRMPPHSVYELRFTIDTGHIWQHCRSESWDGLSLQVRVGMFTRTEWLDFGDLILEIRTPGHCDS